MRTYCAKRQDDGMRLDYFLWKSLERDCPGVFSRSVLTEAVLCGQVVHNSEKTMKPDRKIRMNDEISVEMSSVLAEKRPKKIIQTGTIEPTVIYEDEQTIFVQKPAGLMTHAVRAGDVSLADWVLAHYPQVAQIGDAPMRPGMVHRLDKDTSGVLVIAKTNDAFIELKQLFSERKISKTYFAFTEGHLSRLSGSIEFAITRIPHSEKRSIRKATSDLNSRTALTDYVVLKRYQDCDFVEVHPRTGRTHQIRIHFSALQHPVIGDRLYGVRRKRFSFVVSRQMLHAGRLAFSLFGKEYDVSASLPADFRVFFVGLTPAK